MPTREEMDKYFEDLLAEAIDYILLERVIYHLKENRCQLEKR